MEINRAYCDELDPNVQQRVLLETGAAKFAYSRERETVSAPEEADALRPIIKLMSESRLNCCKINTLSKLLA